MWPALFFGAQHKALPGDGDALVAPGGARQGRRLWRDLRARPPARAPETQAPDRRDRPAAPAGAEEEGRKARGGLPWYLQGHSFLRKVSTCPELKFAVIRG